jgi:hypothetical protein
MSGLEAAGFPEVKAMNMNANFLEALEPKAQDDKMEVQ